MCLRGLLHGPSSQDEYDQKRVEEEQKWIEEDVHPDSVFHDSAGKPNALVHDSFFGLLKDIHVKGSSDSISGEVLQRGADREVKFTQRPGFIRFEVPDPFFSRGFSHAEDRSPSGLDHL